MMTRIHAMYHGSKQMLVFLIVIFLACTTASVVMTVIANLNASAVEIILSGNNMCFNINDSPGSLQSLNYLMFIPTFVWEILALSLSLWIVIKHFRELRQSSTGSIIEDCFTALIRSHVPYFVGFAAMSLFDIGLLSPNLSNPTTVGSGIYYGVFQFAQFVQMFVLGPRLVLSIRAYNAKLVANSDEGTRMTTIVFQERGDVSTSVGV
ncbi:hypothetical protein DEU56DRAFT_827942 [Suillus clintonianus]|uniref:uncharacterized protein n=1 Tax=Suillus clintonianus TaxID=1904413 RepID=UPI001B879E41|nr:uncharacterized protein DEU56DRAFT_827942 [Suillus clintonianus]KAG2124171.1 hypothetical protein DEU56DRAFT_827942 [Suillus clintonianus]